MYIKRHIEKTVIAYTTMFGAILVSGPRQVGKTTMLRNISREINYVTLDNPILLQNAKEETGSFFKDNLPPIFIDEIQYAPELFSYIKMYIDEKHTKGLFFLSGSQQFKMMKNVSESLAGRIGILNLLGLSVREIRNEKFDRSFLPSEEFLQERHMNYNILNYQDLWKLIWQGCMPELYSSNTIKWQDFYASYTNTYIERDVSELLQVGDRLKFIKFMTVLASITGCLLNLSAIASAVEISQPTAQRWLSVLHTSNIIYLLQPYYNNITKRAIKTPKLYFLDTGLAAFLTRWTTPDVLQMGASAGHYFETFVVSEIIKGYYNNGIIDPPLYFYRDKEHNEIDLLIYENGTIYPLEIKKTSNPKKNDIKAFTQIDKISGIKRGSGGIICCYEQMLTLQGQDKVIPVGML